MIMVGNALKYRHQTSMLVGEMVLAKMTTLLNYLIE